MNNMTQIELINFLFLFSVVLVEETSSVPPAAETASKSSSKIVSLIPRLEDDDFSVKILEVSEETKKVYEEFRKEVLTRFSEF